MMYHSFTTSYTGGHPPLRTRGALYPARAACLHIPYACLPGLGGSRLSGHQGA
jgi:hypothetical protein